MNIEYDNHKGVGLPMADAGRPIFASATSGRLGHILLIHALMSMCPRCRARDGGARECRDLLRNSRRLALFQPPALSFVDREINAAADMQHRLPKARTAFTACEYSHQL
jgi:hypothetical protein